MSDPVFLIACALIVALTVAAIYLFGQALQATTDRKRLTVQLATTKALLADSRQREYFVLNQLAAALGREHPFPEDVPGAAGSLGDEVEAWLASTPPNSEDF